jgi:hypothetical protein
MAWKLEEKLMAMIASHFASGNSSIGATCWMPALFTRMSTLPSAASAARTMPATASPRDRSASEKGASSTPIAAPTSRRARAMSSGRPRPFSITLAPACA